MYGNQLEWRYNAQARNGQIILQRLIMEAFIQSIFHTWVGEILACIDATVGLTVQYQIGINAITINTAQR